MALRRKGPSDINYLGFRGIAKKLFFFFTVFRNFYDRLIIIFFKKKVSDSVGDNLGTIILLTVILEFYVQCVMYLYNIVG